MTGIDDSTNGPSKSDNDYALPTDSSVGLHETSYDNEKYEEKWSGIKQGLDSDELDTEFVTGNIADLMCEEFDFICRKDDKEKTLLVYHKDEGIYKSDGEEFLGEHLVENLDRQYYSKRITKSVSESIKPSYYKDSSDIGKMDGKVCLENCVLDLSNPSNPQPERFTPKYPLTSKIPIEYDPDAECPKFEEYLSEVAATSKDRKKLQEYAGYCLHHWNTPYNRALLLLGPTQSGKSVFLNLLTDLLGDDNVLNETVQRLCNKDFPQAGLLDTIANINADLGTGKIRDTGVFKRFIAGDKVEIEPKFKGQIKIEPDQKHLYAANQVPEVPDADGAFYERLLFVKFPNTIPRDDRNPQLKNELLEESSGILNWMLDGYARLMDQNGFTNDRDKEQSASIWKQYGDSISRFIEKSIVEDLTNEIDAKEVYEHYKMKTKSEGLSPKRQKALTERLHQNFSMNKTREGTGDMRYTVYQGIDLKSDDDDVEVTGIWLVSSIFFAMSMWYVNTVWIQTYCILSSDQPTHTSS